jgi:hypothetical protein
LLAVCVPLVATAQDVSLEDFPDEAQVTPLPANERAYTIAVQQGRDLASRLGKADDSLWKDVSACFDVTSVGEAALGQKLLTQANSLEKLGEAARVARVERETAENGTEPKALSDALAREQQARDAANAVLRSLENSLETLFRPKSITSDEFARIVLKPKALEACQRVRERQLAFYGPTVQERLTKIDQQLTDSTRQEAHDNDLYRKASSLATALSNETGNGERPGAPDRVAASIFSALGAEREQDGTQAVFTLNIPGVLGRNIPEIKDASLRHLFARISVPLSATEPPSLPTDETPDEARPDVSRFSLTLGSSIVDASDPRLPTHDKCYRAVETVEPLPARFEQVAVEQVLARRQPLYQLCTRAAVYSQRLAWRVAGQVLTRHEEGGDQSDLEIAAGALVYSPQPWLIISPFYRRSFLPRPINDWGLSLSVGGNLGGNTTGTNAWGRLGLDVVLLLTDVLGDGNNGGLTARLVPTFSFPVAGGAFFTLAAGPRFTGDAGTGFLATAALTFDADRITNTLLQQQ